MESRVQRSCFYLELVFRGSLNVFGDGVAVSGSGKQRSEDEKVERALQELDPGRGITEHCVDILRFIVQRVYSDELVG
jgi:hypothetical protein